MAGSEESVAILPRMPKHLVIVESPAKARTIERYLGDDYRVLASYGHVRDLPDNPGKGKFGVDVDNGFTPEYVIAEDRRKQVADIEKAAKSVDTVYLATDLDREGEAIAWHVAEAAHVPSSKTQRVTFSEITERAIKEAFAHPRAIDTNLVDAQQARRIVDRLVGYTLSPLLSRKVRSGLSAGRGQSGAVRLVAQRERGPGFRGGGGRGARGGPGGLRVAVHDAQGPRVQDEVEGRPGGARVDPADVVRARPRRDGEVPQGGRAAPVSPDLAACTGQPDG